MEEIAASDLLVWMDDETYGVDAANLADILNKMLARIKALEEELGGLRWE